MDYDDKVQLCQFVKDLVIQELINEQLLDEDVAEEFTDRFQLMIYKPKWFEKWTDKHHPKLNKDGYYVKIIHMRQKPNPVKKIIDRLLQ